MSTSEFSSKQEQFKRIVDSPDKLTTLLIGEFGDIIRSELFKDKAEEIASMLYEKTDECVKIKPLSPIIPPSMPSSGNSSVSLKVS